jgi:hypothetical protein
MWRPRASSDNINKLISGVSILSGGKSCLDRKNWMTTYGLPSCLAAQLALKSTKYVSVSCMKHYDFLLELTIITGEKFDVNICYFCARMVI